MDNDFINYGSALPLSQYWERSTIKELTSVAHGIVHGAFATPQELRDKLADIIGWLSTEHCGDSVMIGVDPAVASTEYTAATIAGAYMQAIEPLPPLPAPRVEPYDLIRYEVINGRCSYCGHFADPIELPDGGFTFSDRCQHCDDYNQEVIYE